jgi:DNA/RNA endonuclease YhcR with UshA esterase domain
VAKKQMPRPAEGKDVEITGKIKEWRGRAEIVLKDSGQLDGLAEKLPPIPATYDADHHGNFSAGKYSAPRSKHARTRRPSQPADEIDEE